MLNHISPLRTLRLGWGLVGAVTLAGGAARLHGQTPDQLGRLVDEALRANRGLEQARLTEDEAAAAMREARGRLLPSVSVESRYSEQRGGVDLGDVINPLHAALNQLAGSDRFPTGLSLPLPPAHETRLRLTQPLLNEGLRANYSLARHHREVARQLRLAAARELAANVQVSYLGLAVARSAARIYEATLGRVEEAERVAQRLVAAGAATPDAVYRARADRSEVEQQLAEAREQAHTALRGLNRLLGRPVETPFEEIPDSSLCFDLRVTEQAAIDHALTHREELRWAEAFIRAADAAVHAATAGFLPTASIALDYGFQGPEPSFGPGEDFLVGSLVISWSPFNGGRTLARRRGASSAATRARVHREDVAEQIRMEVRQAYEATLVARSAITTAEDRLAAARRTFELVRRRHQEGAATQAEFVDARTALTGAELNQAMTVYQYGARFVELQRAAALRTINPE